MIIQSFLISRGGGPRTPCDASRGDKQMGEANRVLPGSHKSAEPIEAGRAGTSDPVSGPACKPAMARETEPMADASSEYGPRQLGSRREGLRAREGLARFGDVRAGGARRAASQPLDGIAWSSGQISHGVKSAPKAGERSVSEPKNLAFASTACRQRMTEATGDRVGEGRSLHISPRAGKPSTWRREAVDTECRQEVDLCPAR